MRRAARHPGRHPVTAPRRRAGGRQRAGQGRERAATCSIARAAGSSGSASTTGAPASPPWRSATLSGTLASSGHGRVLSRGQALGDDRAAARAEELEHCRRVRRSRPCSRPRRSIRLAGLAGDDARALGDVGRRRLRGRDDDHLGVRQQLPERDRDVAGAGRQVEQQHVEVAEVDVGEELLSSCGAASARARRRRRTTRAAGSVGSTNMPIEMTFTPCATGGRIMSSTRVGRAALPCSSTRPRMPGIEKPCTSASTSPTARPRAASATARFAVIVDLPTPPLPLVTAMTRVSVPGPNGLLRAARPPRRRSVRARALLGRHHRERRRRPRRRPATAAAACAHVALDAVGGRASDDREPDVDRATRPSSPATTRVDHVELGDRACGSRGRCTRAERARAPRSVERGRVSGGIARASSSSRAVELLEQRRAARRG